MIQEIDNSTYSSQLISLTNTSVATTPTATTADTLLPAGSVSFFKMASGDKVALLGLVATTGTATVTAMESVTI